MHKNRRYRFVRDRIKAILLLNAGYGFEEAAKILLIDDSTIRDWSSKYKKEGIEGLLKTKHKGGSSKLNCVEQEELSSHLASKIYLTSKEVCAYVFETYAVEYSVKGMTSLLHKLGFSYKKPKQLPGKADLEKQKSFIDQYEQVKSNKGKEDHIYFMDGVHQLHNSQPAYGWIKKGKDQILKTNTGRSRINFNGAYDLENQEVIIREDERINAQSTILLLEQMLKHQPEGLLYIVLDNARYYRANLVKEFLEQNIRIKLLFLPPYSPNLNTIERLWKFFKKKITYNKYYEKFSVFKEKCWEFFDNIEQYKTELSSLMTDNFQLIQV